MLHPPCIIFTPFLSQIAVLSEDLLAAQAQLAALVPAYKGLREAGSGKEGREAFNKELEHTVAVLRAELDLRDGRVRLRRQFFYTHKTAAATRFAIFAHALSSRSRPSESRTRCQSLNSFSPSRTRAPCALLPPPGGFLRTVRECRWRSSSGS